MKKYDLIVIGTGPAGEKAAVKAAYFGYKVAIIEKGHPLGGAMVVTGTLPSKTLKETALYYSGKYEKGLYGIERDLQREASIEDFMFRKNLVTKSEAEAVEKNLHLHGVSLYQGVASFEDKHSIKVTSVASEEVIYGEYIIIATGTYPYHPPSIPFDGYRIHDSDTILELTRFPKSLCVVGAGVIGCEYATLMATMGIQVFLVNNDDCILPFLDKEISDELITRMAEAGISILFNTVIKKVSSPTNDEEFIKVELRDGTIFEVDMFLFAAGRSGNTQALELEKVGIKVTERKMIPVDKTYKTCVPNIYAVGDVTGFPALASTSSDQGRVAVAHIFKTKDLKHLPENFPFGIYTIPEVSMVGLTEESAKDQGIDFCCGKARYADMARGKILGAKSGFIKLVFEKKSLKILGVHIIGNIATEIIHYGLLLVEEQKTLNDVIATVFNYPTLHDLYKYAAYDGLSTISGRRIKD